MVSVELNGGLFLPLGLRQNVVTNPSSNRLNSAQSI
jgi:hypothetical protein